MRAIGVPAVCSGVAAASSIIYFSLMGVVFGDVLLGKVILTISEVAVIQIIFIPQSWIYVLSSFSPAELRERFSSGVNFEVVGGAAGLLVTILYTVVIKDSGLIGASFYIAIYLSLWIAGLTAALGVVRYREEWLKYSIWALTPSSIRLVVMFLFSFDVLNTPDVEIENNQVYLMLFAYFLPELVRFIVIYPALLLADYKKLDFEKHRVNLKHVLKNWLFDCGSVTLEVGDKIIIGYLFGPLILVPYYFARRFSIVATMFLEPYFASRYQQLSLGEDDLLLHKYWNTFFIAILVSIVSAVLIGLFVTIAFQVDFISEFIPASIKSEMMFFIIVLFIDCMLASNRWSRYVSQVGRLSIHLLIGRVGIFILFAILCSSKLFGGSWLSVVLPLTVLWGLDLILLIIILKVVSRKCSVN